MGVDFKYSTLVYKVARPRGSAKAVSTVSRQGPSVPLTSRGDEVSHVFARISKVNSG